MDRRLPAGGGQPETEEYVADVDPPARPLTGRVYAANLQSLIGWVSSTGSGGCLSIVADEWAAELLFRADSLVGVCHSGERDLAGLDALLLRAAHEPGELDFGLTSAEPDLGAGVLMTSAQLVAHLDRVMSEAAQLIEVAPSWMAVPRVVATNELSVDGPINVYRADVPLLVDVDGRRTIADLASKYGLARSLRSLHSLVRARVIRIDRPQFVEHPAAILPNVVTPQVRVPAVWSVGACALACLSLALASYLAPTAVVPVLGAFALGAPLLWLSWTHPELCLLGLLCLTAGLLRGADLYIPLPLGGLYPNDVALLGLLALLAVRALVTGGLRVDWWPVNRALLVFLGLVLASLVYATRFREVELRQALNELRPLAYYSLSILTVMAITRRRQRIALVVGLFVLADVIGAALFLQQFAGAGSFLLPGMADWQVDAVGATGITGEPSGTPGQGFGFVRVVPPAHLLLFILSVLGFVWASASGLRRSIRVLCAAQFVFLNAAMLLTYTRAQWIASVISLAIVVVLLPRAVRARLMGYGLVGVATALLGVGLVGAGIQPPIEVPAFGAIISRATSTLSPDQTFNSSSLQWRGFEIEAALQSLVNAPQGVGLGNAYRPVTTFGGEAAGYQGAEPLNRFVHNSYLYIAVKVGVLGLAAFLWFCLAFVTNGWRVFRRLADGPDRWLMLAMLAAFVGIMQWSFTEANFMQTGSTVVIGLMIGLAGTLVRTATPAGQDLRGVR